MDPGVSSSCLVDAAVLEEIFDEHIGDTVAHELDRGHVGGAQRVHMNLLNAKCTYIKNGNLRKCVHRKMYTQSTSFYFPPLSSLLYFLSLFLLHLLNVHRLKVDP